MIVREKVLDYPSDLNFDYVAPKERVLFFDIETTGLMRKSSFIYLIGVVVCESGIWKERQYFAQSPEDEHELLNRFSLEIKEKRKSGRVILLSFNGDGFDIPFIKTALRGYGVNEQAVFDKTISLDLFKLVKPLKNFLGLTNCKLKTVEKFFDLDREDRYSGRELIYVYQDYLSLISPVDETGNESNLKKDELLEILLLHNAEDIANMPLIMGLYGYKELVDGNFEIFENKIIEYDSFPEKKKVWDMKASLSMPVPKGLFFEENGVVLSIGEENKIVINLAVPVFEGELKYFYLDYKNYYYLPLEDYAIHKSIGKYLDKRSRKQATKSTCYLKKTSLFVPESEAIITPIFYKDETKTQKYGELSEIFKGNDRKLADNIAKRYILSVINQIS